MVRPETAYKGLIGALPWTGPDKAQAQQRGANALVDDGSVRTCTLKPQRPHLAARHGAAHALAPEMGRAVDDELACTV